MEPTRDERTPAGVGSDTGLAPLVWEIRDDRPSVEFRPFGPTPRAWVEPLLSTATSATARPRTSSARRWAGRVAARLSSPTFLQLHGRSPMETSRIATVSVADAAEALAGSTTVEWGGGRAAGHLLLGPFRAQPGELGQPSVADATLHGHGMRRLRVTVAIYGYGNGRCSIQIRPRYRRPRTARRLRHCLTSTHGAADRLRDLVHTVDFTPPHDPITHAITPPFAPANAI